MHAAAAAQFSSQNKRTSLHTGCDLEEKILPIELYVKRANGLGITDYLKPPLSYWAYQRCHCHLAA